jgi:predicted RNA-binding Zn-ribbon protein involved in translation (DUF1610 family)
MTFLLVAAMVILFGVAAYRHAATGRTAAGGEDRSVRCVQCGYDLRGTPHQCPECGVVIADRRRFLRSLGKDWPANPIEPVIGSDDAAGGGALVDLCRTDNPTEAYLLHQQLTARGVRCVLNHERSTQQSVYDINASHHVRVTVRAADERIAREYLCRAQGIPADLVEPVLSGQRKVVVA